MECVQRLTVKKLIFKFKTEINNKKMQNGSIYIITCLSTNKSYIGKTTETINRRWKRHIVYKNKYCRLLSEVIKIYSRNGYWS